MKQWHTTTDTTHPSNLDVRVTYVNTQGQLTFAGWLT